MDKIKAVVFFIFISLIVSCQQHPLEKSFVTSGTYLTVTSYNPKAADIVYSEFRRLNMIFNPYDELSEISKFNRSLPNVAIKVSDEFIELLKYSQQFYQFSNAAFDPGKAKLYKFWKRYITSKQLYHFPQKAAVEKLANAGGISGIVVDFFNSTVTKLDKKVVLDFSAIAKGYMVDKAAEALKRQGINDVLINAGGEIYCLGKNKGKSWEVGIQDPLVKNAVVDTILLEDEAAATSGDYEQFFVYKKKRYSHLIDPLTGYPADNDVLSVTVIASKCVVADALATAFFIMGKDEVKNKCEQDTFIKDNNVSVYMIVGDEKKVYRF